MMKLTPPPQSMFPVLIAAAVVLIVAGFGASHLLTEYVSYPMDVWRMDLDDLLANVGLFLVGLAAFLTVRQKAKTAEEKANALDDKLNGRLADLIRDEMELAGLSQTMLTMETRVEKVEAERDKCHQELAEMRDWLKRQLGER